VKDKERNNIMENEITKKEIENGFQRVVYINPNASEESLKMLEEIKKIFNSPLIINNH